MLSIIFVSLCLLNSTLCFAKAAECTSDNPAKAPTTFRGTKITAENLHLLGPQLSPEMQQALVPLVPAFTALCRNVPQPQDKEIINAALGENLTNLSVHNKAFELLSHLVKISGFSNRLQSMLVTKGVWPGQLFMTTNGQYIVLHEDTYKRLSDVLPAFIPTYQTASRKMRYLLCDETIRLQGLKRVNVTEIYLYLLNPEEGPHDENCISIEKKVDGKPLERRMLSIHFSGDHVQELFTLIETVGIWTLIKGDYDLSDPEAGNWYIDDILRDENGILYLIDLEQPNNSNPTRFAAPEDAEHHGNIKSGIEQLAVLCAHDPKKLACLIKLVRESKKINSRNFTERFKKEIYSVLEQVRTAVMNDRPSINSI